MEFKLRGAKRPRGPTRCTPQACVCSATLSFRRCHALDPLERIPETRRFRSIGLSCSCLGLNSKVVCDRDLIGAHSQLRSFASNTSILLPDELLLIICTISQSLAQDNIVPVTRLESGI
jgi:hypothetical protein